MNRLLEEAELTMAPDDCVAVTAEVRRYLTDGAWAHAYDTHPAELLAAEINSDDDASTCAAAP